MHELRATGLRGRITVRRVVLAILATAAMVYLSALLYLISQETRLVFQAGLGLGTSRPAVPYAQVDLTRSDGGKLFAWTLEQDPHRPWVLFLHGNAATIGSRVNVTRYEHLYALGLNVMAPEYRGFAGLNGAPSEQGVSDDARTAYEYLRRARQVPADRIVIYGWSLGSAIAVNLASTVPEAGLILEGAPASLVAIGQRRYPLMPVRLVMRNPFDSIVKIQSIHAPMLFIHSSEDTVIPIAEGRRLYDAAPSPRTFVEVHGGHVNSSDVDGATFYGAIGRFLDERGLRKGN
jgi:uncharacterized protein